MEGIAQLNQRFEEIFSVSAQAAVRAPGRVNLIGEHTDYNDGFVLPIAIERHVIALYRPRPDKIINLASTAMPQRVAVDLSMPITKGQPSWANYSRGVAAGLLERRLAICGADILIHSTVPHGSGLSSSAALEVATALALLGASKLDGAVGGSELAKLCQKAEHEFAGTPCGIMDQSICVMGQAGKALLLDCRSNQTRHIPFDDPNLVLLVADTQVKHELNDGGYALRRQQCEEAAEILKVKALRDANPQTVENAAKQGLLSGKQLMRARHIVSDILRTLEAAHALEKGDYKLFGRLMYASHDSLKEDFEISCEELNLIVDAAKKCSGVFGARMTGGGFGGCAIILAQSKNADAIADAVSSEFAVKFGRRCPIFATRAADGAGVHEIVH